MYIPFNYFSSSTVFPRRFSLTPRADGDVSEVTPGESESSSFSSTTNSIATSSSLDGVTSASAEGSAFELTTESEGTTSGSLDAASTDAPSVEITSTSSELDLTQTTNEGVGSTSISTSTAPSISAVSSSVEISLSTSSDLELTQTSSVSVDPTSIETSLVDAPITSLSVTTSPVEITSSTSGELELTQATSVSVVPTSIAASSVDASVPSPSAVLSTSSEEFTLVSSSSDAAISAFSVSDATSPSITLSPVSLTSEPATFSVTPSISIPLGTTDSSTSADISSSSIEISPESLASEVASTDNAGPISTSIPVSASTILPLSSVEITSSPSADPSSISTISADAAAPLSSVELSPASNSDANSAVVPSTTSALPSASLGASDPVSRVTAASAVSTSVPQSTSTSGSSSSSDSTDSTDSSESTNEPSSENGATSSSSESQTPEESSDATSGTVTDSAISGVGSSSDISSDLATSTISSVAESETVTSITSAATDTTTLSDSTSTVSTVASAPEDSLSVDLSSTSDSTDSLLSTFGSDESLSIVATSTLDSTGLSFSTSDVSETISASASLGDSSAFLTATDSESVIETSAATGSETDTALTVTLTPSSVDDDTTSFTPVPNVTSTLSTASDDESTLSAASPSAVNRIVDGGTSFDFSTVQTETIVEPTPQAVQDQDPSLTVSTDDNGNSPSNSVLGTGGRTTFGSSGTAGSPPSTGTSTGNPFPTNTGDGGGTNNTGISSNAVNESMAPGTIAGITISVIGSLALALIVAFLLLRRRRLRDRRRALAHESFGPGVSRSNTPSSRHAPSPSGVAFLSSFRNLGRRSSLDDDGRRGGGIGGIFSRVIPWKRNAPGVMREKGREVMNEKPAGVYERGLGAGQGSFLPPLAPIKSISPIPPFGAIPPSNANVNSSSNANANPFADPSPAPRSGIPVESGQARTPNLSQGGGAYAAAAAIGVGMPPTGETKDQAPRPDDPFWDPEDLLPPALRLSALKNQAAAWKATSANAPAIPSGSGPASVASTGFAGAISGAGTVIPRSTPESGKASADAVSSGGLVPLDPFADPGIQPNNATTNIHPISPIEMSKQEIIPDIFDYRASSSSSAGYDEGEGQLHSSWVTQKAWVDAGSVRSDTPSSLTSSFYRGQDRNPPQPPMSNDKYAVLGGTSSSGPSSRSGSSVIASSLGSGIGVDSDSSLHHVSGLPLGLGLGVLRSQSPDSERNNAFGLGFFAGKEDVSRRDEDLESGIDRKRTSNGSGVSGESYETGRYQMFGNAL